ncbi:hypothetical protein T492DRAFT_872543 [Pavlovales sp. CCMP2436]|nr:hypothetical protein T492DRAFT_872543 [Pavlovales sp. CCMP2436]
MFSGWGTQPGAEEANGPLEALAHWASVQPERAVFTFVGDKGEQVAQLTYGQLHAAADNVARHLRFVAKLSVGDRALLVYPPGLDFIVGYLGCLRAGVIAVPVFPPEPNRLSKDLALFATTQASSGAKVALTNTLYSHAKKLAGLAQLLKRDGGKWPDLTWIVTDAVGKAPEGELEMSAPSAVAFLQYTSGSTSEPKGVRITHASLAHNLRWIVHALGVNRQTVEVSWLPQYHDMGLIGAYLGLLVCGGEGIYLSPFSFVRDATLWPRLLSDRRATHTQAPSFAYALAARKWLALEPAARPKLDLSAIKHMPIDPEAMGAFVKAFGPFGLRRDAIFPTYGLAEHTVFVCSGGR